MNAIPYFDYSMAPFWPSYQNKIIGVLNRVLREQSGSGIRRILLRLPGNMATSSATENHGSVWPLSKPSVR